MKCCNTGLHCLLRWFAIPSNIWLPLCLFTCIFSFSNANLEKENHLKNPTVYKSPSLQLSSKPCSLLITLSTVSLEQQIKLLSRLQNGIFFFFPQIRVNMLIFWYQNISLSVWRKGILLTTWWEGELVQPLRKTVSGFLKN